MPPRIRKLALTIHIAASVGWLGSVGGFLALAVTGMTSGYPQLVRATYLSMEVISWFVLVPLSLAPLLTGLIQSLGTVWGLVRHYCVLFKLLINVFATIVLLMYMPTLRDSGDRAAVTPTFSANHDAVQTASPVLHAGAAMLLLITATVLSVYKPRAVTPYGRRKYREQRPATQDSQ